MYHHVMNIDKRARVNLASLVVKVRRDECDNRHHRNELECDDTQQRFAGIDRLECRRACLEQWGVLHEDQNHKTEP